ncbi:MAG TPA: acetylxylan esterase [Bryobacteraceae bacterium]|nr:acetylxylan esterase [Bryobacteraceae bacterium]
MKIFLLAALLIALAAASNAQTSDKLNFLEGLDEFEHVSEMLPAYLKQHAEELLQKREREVTSMATLADVARRKALLREVMTRDLGGFPARTPLNARVTGTLDRGDYKIEKIIFESQPHFYVTANLYLPKTGQPPYPAVLYPLGHELGAKSHIAWQQMLGSLAKKGYVALAWDPIGQGERIQIYDPDFEDSKVRASTTEHTVEGIQCLLIGDAVARYTIWDGIRALDYLLSRPEVDAKRVACTGNSGGGTHTTYLSALDDRIQVAAPSCYISSWHQMLRTIGPQDAEQVFPNWIRDGLDYPDFIYAFAPKPFLILSAIRDFFPIDGARETFEEVKRVYSRIGAGDKIAMFEADDGHGYTHPRRMAAYPWFARWLKSAEDHEPEPKIEIATEKDLQCTPTGQVVNLPEAETVFTLNRKRAAAIHRPSLSQDALLARVRELTGFAPSHEPLAIRPYGVIERDGYKIEKLVYESEPGIRIPALVFVPNAGAASKKPALVYLNSRGKAAGVSEDVEPFVKSGFVVLSLDARGLGETRVSREINATDFDRYFGDYDSAMTAILIGKTMPGMRAQDIVRGIDLLAVRPDVDAANIFGFGKDAGAVPMLYAALLDSRMRRVALEGMLVSYDWVIQHPIHRQIFEEIVPSALRYFDLPDLAAALAPRPVWVVNAVDALGHPVAMSEIRGAYTSAIRAFEKHGAGNELHLAERKPGHGISDVYAELVQVAAATSPR